MVQHEVGESEFRAEWELEVEDEEVGGCELCKRPQMPLTFHHLIPKQEAHRYRDKLAREDLVRGAHVCRPCHSAIHNCFTNAQLGQTYRTIHRLLDETDDNTLPLRRWVQFASRQRVSRTAAQQRTSVSKHGRGLQYGRGA